MSGNDFKIRRLKVDDAVAWRALRLQALKDEPSAFGMDYELAASLSLEDFQSAIPEAKGPDAILGAFAGEDLLGVAGLKLEAGKKRCHKASIWGVYVHASARRRGVARALIQALLAHAKGHAELLQLSVTTTNVSARALYLSLGFKSYGLERNALKIDGCYFDEELMALEFPVG